MHSRNRINKNKTLYTSILIKPTVLKLFSQEQWMNFSEFCCFNIKGHVLNMKNVSLQLNINVILKNVGKKQLLVPTNFRFGYLHSLK